MITREEIEEMFGDKRQPFKNRNVDHDLIAITLLRERIPYEDCKSIIGGAEHDTLYLCDIEIAIKHLNIADVEILADCNVCIDNNFDCLFLFV